MILGRQFARGAGAGSGESHGDFVMDVIDAATPVATGNVSYTFRLNGKTPKAFLLFSNGAGRNIGGSAVMRDAIGACDGTTQWVTARTNRHNKTTTEAKSYASSSACWVSWSNFGTIDGTAAFVSFSANTVTINYSLVSATAKGIQIIAFAGDNLEVDAQVKSFAPGENTVTTGFESNVIFGSGIQQGSFTASIVSNAVRNFGTITYDGVSIRQTGVSGVAVDALTTTSNAGSVRDDAGFPGAFSATSDFGSVTAIGKTGYTVNVPGASTFSYGLLNLNLPTGWKAWTGAVQYTGGVADPSTLTLNDTTGTAPGLDFAPCFAMVQSTKQSSLNTYQTNTETAGTFYAVVTMDGYRGRSMSIADADGVTTTDTQSIFADQTSTNFIGGAPLSGTHTGTVDIAMDSHSLRNEGIVMTLDSNTAATPYWAAFAIGRIARLNDAAIDYKMLTAPNTTGEVTVYFDLGGRTPKGIFVAGTRTTTKNSVQAQGSLMYGGGTGPGTTEQWFSAVADQTAQTTTNTFRRTNTGSVIGALVASAGTTYHQAKIVSFGPNRVTLNFTTATSFHHYVITAFAGKDVKVKAVANNLTSNGTTIVTTGFQSNFIAAASCQSALSGTSSAHDILSIGMASYDGTTIRQACESGVASDNVSTTSSAGSISNDVLVSGGASSLRALSALGNITATTFDMTSLSFAGTIVTGFFAVKLPTNWKAWVGTPQMGGDTDDYIFRDSDASAPGLTFKPRIVLGSCSQMDTLNTWDTTSISPGAARNFFALSRDGTRRACVGKSSQDNVTTSNEANWSYDQTVGAAGIPFEMGHQAVSRKEIDGHTMLAEGVSMSMLSPTYSDTPYFMMAAIGRIN